MKILRSAREIRFRIAQQLANIRLLLAPPSLSPKTVTGKLPLPDGSFVAEALKDTAYTAHIQELATEIMAHRFPIFGERVETGPEIEWRKDHTHNRATGTDWFRSVPYLDFQQVGDHKNIWELNRHQHLVILAQTYLLKGGDRYLHEIEAELASWWAQNPFVRGMNWASALEVAFRALSWLWVLHLVGKNLSAAIRHRLHESLYRHGCYLESNLSTYFAPNTHLLGEGVALHALGFLFPKTSWRLTGERIVREELTRQVHDDGSYFEQSTYYHVYALDFFLFHYVLTGRASYLEPVLRRMARFLAAVMGPARVLTCLGDDDGGRFFHPYGDRATFGRATLATCASLFPDEGFPVGTEDLAIQAFWWLGPVSVQENLGTFPSLYFPDAGMAAISHGPLQLLIDCGSFGHGGAGHSHSDTLSVTARAGDSEFLTDPGTFTYVADPVARDAFRGSAMHNTIRVDDLDQGDPVKPFRWENKPQVRFRRWFHDRRMTYLDAEYASRGITHRRRFLLLPPGTLVVLDELTGNVPGEHRFEQFWQIGNSSPEIAFSGAELPEREKSWRSPILGSKEPAEVVVFRWTGMLPQSRAAVLTFGNAPAARELRLDGLTLTVDASLQIRFGDDCEPQVETL